MSLVTYPFHEATLDNGLRVVVSPDHNAPIVAVNLWYGVGSRHEQPGRTGFAHLFEHLMFQGSAGVASGEHLGSIQAAGGSCNATTSMDRTNYFETVPVGAAELALWLEADRLATLPEALDQTNLDTQREVVKEEKRQRYDNVPYGHTLRHLLELTFPADHPYGHTTIGSMADLDAATPDDVTAFFTRHYHPGNAVLSLVGDLTVEHALDLANRHFAAIPDHPRSSDPDATPLPQLTDPEHREVTEDVPREAVYLCWRAPHQDDPRFRALELGTDILGSGQSARLARSLVREQDLADSAGISAWGLTGGTSLVFAYAQARDGVGTDELRDALQHDVAALADGPTESEYARAAAQLERDWLSELASVDQRADNFGEATTLLGGPGRVNTLLEEYAAITPAEIATAAHDWLRPENAATLTYRKQTR
ncbi:peptidase M16 [Parenemella sanctibonifatiensis]|uniref:Peptidase M16 n=2 Tax=Parenemella sanctibonifatiensis TaxID=2016505 RepID=A0A255E6W8_9ACTN|nr:pitrilysin family protein [Parenemella sanctibonifatiensis]OYN86701.1 peptidase M16 [Parenemella sanctibonifatiensis]